MDSKELRLFREAYNSINTPQTEEIQEETVAEEQLDEMDIVGKLRSGLNKIGIKGTSPALEREKAADRESRRLGGNRMRQAEGDNTRPTPMKDDVDLFDIVKGHLVSEGLTEEEAIQKMVTMTEEERNAIAEQYTVNVSDIKGGTQAAKNAQAGMKNKKTGEPGRSGTPKAPGGRPHLPGEKQTPAPKKKMSLQLAGADLFDIVKGHLVSEGLTEEEAIQKMVTMTEEERNAIAEQYTINVADVKGGTQAAKNAAAGMKDKKGNPMYKPGVGVTPDFKLKGV